MPVHSWVLTSRSTPGWRCSKSAVNRVTKSSEALPFISQSVTFLEPPAGSASRPQPVRAVAAARAVHTARKRIFT